MHPSDSVFLCNGVRCVIIFIVRKQKRVFAADKGSGVINIKDCTELVAYCISKTSLDGRNI